MNKSKEILASISLTTAIALGVTGCAGGLELNTHTDSTANNQKPTSDFTPALKGLAQNIIELSTKSDSGYVTGQTNKVGLNVPVENNGKLVIETVTSFGKPDPEQVIGVHISQAIPQGRTFDLSIDKMDGGKWSVHCGDNVSVVGAGIAEYGQSQVYFGNKDVRMDTVLAEAVLSDEITFSNKIVDTVAAVPTAVPIAAFPDACSINLGS